MTINETSGQLDDFVNARRQISASVSARALLAEWQRVHPDLRLMTSARLGLALKARGVVSRRSNGMHYLGLRETAGTSRPAVSVQDVDAVRARYSELDAPGGEQEISAVSRWLQTAPAKARGGNETITAVEAAGLTARATGVDVHHGLVVAVTLALGIQVRRRASVRAGLCVASWWVSDRYAEVA